MAEPAGSNPSSPSTTWVWKTRTIRVPAGGQQAREPKARRWHLLPYRDRRKPLTLTITYRGGGECWYQVHARGSIGRFPGATALHDVMSEIYGGS